MLTIVFLIIPLLALGIFYFGTGKDKLFLVASLLWLILSGAIAAGGYFENTLAWPPRFLPILLLSITFTIFFYRRLRYAPLNCNLLLTIHVLRLPIELILFELFLSKQIPVLMTFQGFNFDILTGFSSLLLLVYMLITKRQIPRSFLLVWNICGIVLLTTIVIIAILSSPLPIQQWAFDQPNLALLKFPYVFLPAFLVPIVYLSHFLSIRKLIQ